MSSCTPVACPPNSYGDNVPSTCNCNRGYLGAVTATAVEPHYFISTCSPVPCALSFQNSVSFSTVSEFLTFGHILRFFDDNGIEGLILSMDVFPCIGLNDVVYFGMEELLVSISSDSSLFTVFHANNSYSLQYSSDITHELGSFPPIIKITLKALSSLLASTQITASMDVILKIIPTIISAPILLGQPFEFVLSEDEFPGALVGFVGINFLETSSVNV